MKPTYRFLVSIFHLLSHPSLSLFYRIFDGAGRVAGEAEEGAAVACDVRSDGGGEGEAQEEAEAREKTKRGREEERRRKKKKEEEEEDEDEEGVPRRDPLEVFGTDIMLKILSILDARSVALSLLVCRGWHAVASIDRIWAAKLEEPWLGKAHIPRLSHIQGLSKLAAYSFAVMDSKRTRITKDDLCDHAWDFHFNKAAPEYWRNLDPYWKGSGPPMRRYFHPDGSQSADPGAKVWGGHECCYLTVTSIVGEDKMREHSEG